MGIIKFDYVKNVAETKEIKTVKKTKVKQISRGKLRRKADFTLRLTEEKIKKLEEEIYELDIDIQKNASDYKKLTKLTEKSEDFRKELNILYEKWIDLTEEAL